MARAEGAAGRDIRRKRGQRRSSRYIPIMGREQRCVNGTVHRDRQGGDPGRGWVQPRPSSKARRAAAPREETSTLR